MQRFLGLVIVITANYKPPFFIIDFYKMWELNNGQPEPESTATIPYQCDLICGLQVNTYLTTSIYFILLNCIFFRAAAPPCGQKLEKQRTATNVHVLYFFIYKITLSKIKC